MFLFFYHYSIIPAFHYSRISFGFWYECFGKDAHLVRRLDHCRWFSPLDWGKDPVDW